jgi:hypothetical protein
MGCGQRGQALAPVRSGDSPLGFLLGKSSGSVFEGNGIVGGACYFWGEVRNHVE